MTGHEADTFSSGSRMCPEWIEQQLAHEVRDINGRAYNRTKHLDQRFSMMQRWADYLDELKEQAAGSNVIAANFG